VYKFRVPKVEEHVEEEKVIGLDLLHPGHPFLW
jgi:hypothetical protein